MARITEDEDLRITDDIGMRVTNDDNSFTDLQMERMNVQKWCDPEYWCNVNFWCGESLYNTFIDKGENLDD